MTNGAVWLWALVVSLGFWLGVARVLLELLA